MDLPDLEAEAREKIDATFYDYIAGGADDEGTLAENESPWSRWRLRPKVLRDVRTIDTSTTLLGETVSSPVAIAPMAIMQMMDEFERPHGNTVASQWFAHAAQRHMHEFGTRSEHSGMIFLCPLALCSMRS